METDAFLRGAARAFALSALFGSVVSVRQDVRGEPLGVGLPIPVAAALIVGWGAGVAAPWPMPVAAVVATSRRYRWRHHPALCASLGVACIAGTLVEPVTWRRRRWSGAIVAAISMNVTTSIVMIVAGLLQLHQASRSQ